MAIFMDNKLSKNVLRKKKKVEQKRDFISLIKKNKIFFFFSLATNTQIEGSDYKPTYTHVPIVHKGDLIWTIAILVQQL